MTQELLDRIHNVRFAPVRLREGYDMGEVDLLLDEVTDAVSQGLPVRPLVDAARFTPVRLREGYDMGDVDDFLEEIATAATSSTPPVSATSVTSVPGTPASPATAEAPSHPVDVPPTRSVIEEQHGLLSRLFRRRR